MHDTRRAILIILAGTAGCVVGLGQSGPAKLPEGRGKELIERICTDCHEIGTVINQRHDNEGWQKTVKDMVSRGADGTDEELKAVVEYLAKNFGPKASEKK